MTEMSSLLSSMRDKWHKDKDVEEGREAKTPRKLEVVSDADFNMNQMEEFNSKKGHEYVSRNSLIFESQVPDQGNYDSKISNSKAFEKGDPDKRKNLFASLAKLKDGQKKKKEEMTKIGEADNYESNASNKSKASNMAEAKRKNQLDRIIAELNKLNIKDSEKKLNNLIESLNKRFFWDNPNNAADLNKAQDDPENSKLFQYWKMYSMQFFKPSKPIKSEATDINGAKMKKGKKEKTCSRKMDRQIKNINVRFGDDDESSGCTLTFDYEDNHADTNVAIVDGEKIADDQALEKLKKKHEQTKNKLVATKSYKNLDNEDTTNNPGDTSIFEGKKEVAFQSISSIDNEEARPVKSQILEKKPVTALQNKTDEDHFISSLDPVKDKVKIGLLKQLQNEEPCDRTYGIKQLSINSDEFMRSFMKNFIVDPFYNLDLIVDDNEMFDDYTDEQIGELQEKEIKRCFKRNKLVRDQTEKRTNEKEPERVRKMKDMSETPYKFKPYIENCDSQEGEHEHSDANSEFDEKDSEEGLEEIDVPVRQNTKLLPTIGDVKEHLKTYDLQYFSNIKQTFKQKHAFKLNPVIDYPEAEHIPFVNFSLPGISDPAKNTTLDLTQQDNEWRSFKSFNEFTGITWRGSCNKQIGTDKKFHMKFIVIKRNHLLWFDDKKDKKASKYINLSKATISEVYEQMPGSKVFTVTGRNQSKKKLTIALDNDDSKDLMYVINIYLTQRTLKLGFIKEEFKDDFRVWTRFLLDAKAKYLFFEPDTKNIPPIPDDLLNALSVKHKMNAIMFKGVPRKALKMKTLVKTLIRGGIHLKRIKFEDCDQTLEDLKDLGTYLSSEAGDGVHYINLKNNNIGDEGAAYLIKIFEQKAAKSADWEMEYFNQSETELTDKFLYELKSFVEIYHNRDLIEFDMSYNKLTEKGLMYQSEITTKYRAIGTLRVEHNNIRQETEAGSNFIQEFLKIQKGNTAQASMSIHGNLITTVDCLFPMIKFMFNSPALKEMKFSFDPKLLVDIDFEKLKKGLKFFKLLELTPENDAGVYVFTEDEDADHID